MTKQIRVTIKPDGVTTVDAEGFQGVGCKDATEVLVMAISGGEAKDRKDDPKPEFYAETGQQQTL